MSTSKAVENFESTPALEFTVFPKLLLELRIMIWRFAANHQRPITIHDFGGSGCQRTGRFAKHNATAVPGVLHANLEARATALKYYTLRFGPQFNDNPIYFNYNADGLCFPNFNDLDAYYGLLSRELFGLVTRPAKIQVTPAHLELEDNLKRLVIGSSNIYSETGCSSVSGVLMKCLSRYLGPNAGLGHHSCRTCEQVRDSQQGTKYTKNYHDHLGKVTGFHSGGDG